MNEESVPYYCQSMDFTKLLNDYPPAPMFYDRVFRITREKLRDTQETRFRSIVAGAWQVPFFKRHWSAAGLEPDDIRGLGDLWKIPPYTVHDMRDSIANQPPFGDFMRVSPADGKHMPLVLQTSGGTTGLPRPMLYGPQEREIMALLRGRSLHMHGVRPGDIVQVTLSLGLSNAGLLLREAIWKYTGAVSLMTGSGNSTPSRRQIEIAQAWGTNVIVGFPSYLRHLALVSRDEMNIDPRNLGIRILHSHLGLEDRKVIEEMWGAPCYDSYGIHESGLMASECTHKTGMHIFEDAYILEIVDPETDQPVSAGQKGNIYITSLYRFDVPVIRYNVNDISAIMQGTCACGSTLLRLEKIFGRSDNMIKLRGTNIFPEAVGVLISEDPRTTGEFFCIVEQVPPAGRDEMTVMVEIAENTVAMTIVQQDLERRLREALGVKIKVQPVERGALDQYTEVTKTSKVKRLLDKRKAIV